MYEAFVTVITKPKQWPVPYWKGHWDFKLPDGGSVRAAKCLFIHKVGAKNCFSLEVNKILSSLNHNPRESTKHFVRIK